MATQTSDIRKVALASFIGSTLEWYDFFIFGTATALVFNKLFFPEFDPVTGMIAAFATFAIGFIARPLGGIVFGHFGDRIGRKAMLILSLTMMGGITFLIGLIPTYAVLGVGAPILLTVLRFLQGFAVGGEWGGATLMVVEHAPNETRGFFGSWPQMGIPAALLLSSGVMALVGGLTTPEQFMAWGWRLPFLFSGILLVFGIFLRRRLAESPSFQKLKSGGERQRLPIVDVLGKHGKKTALLVACQAAENTSFYIVAVYSLVYLTTVVGIDRATALNSLMIAAVFCFIAQPLFAGLSDRIGRKRVFMGGMIFNGLFIVPFFLLMDTASVFWITAAMTVSIIFGQATTQSTQPSLFAEQYGASVRYSGVSVAYQFATVLWSGPTPMIAAALWAWSGSWIPLACYIIAAACLSVVTIIPLREAAGADLEDEQSGEVPQPASSATTMSNDPRILRNALGSFATGVTVVTTRSADGQDIGRTANSFSSVSLDPPMILWSLAKTSSSFDDFRQAGHFAVHILSAEQSDISGLFASKKEDKFEGLTVERGDGDIPLLKDCAARFECRTAHQYEGGDHIIFVGEITGFEHSSTPPLVFHGGQYGRLIRHAGENTSFEKTESSLSPDDFIYQISRVFYQIRNDAVVERRRRGWSGADYAVLTLLGHEDGRTLDTISEIGRSRGDEITDETMAKLEAEGLIEIDGTAPRRAHLTGAGRKAMMEIVAMLKAAEADCLALLDENEVWVLKQLLNRLATSNASGWPPVRQQAAVASA